ncbi:MAG: 30S ribosomal protein S14 [Gammaproteobacteria bacterium]
MAKNSMVQRELKRSKMVARYAEKRNALKATIKSANTGFEERMAAVEALQKLPRDSAAVRQHNRCRITGRPHGVYRKFGLCRNKIREAAMRGDIPGLVKASW